MSKTSYLTIYNNRGPDFVWASLRDKSALKRDGKATSDFYELPEIYSDIASFFDVINNRDIPQEVILHAFPDHYKAWQWYISSYPSSQKWYLEALLLTDLPLYKIVEKLGETDAALAVDVYKRAFFNIPTEYKNNLGWMRSHIWVPSMLHTSNLYYYDFIYKAAAVYGSVYLLDTLISPEALPPATLAWTQQMVRDNRTKHMLTSGNIYTTLNTDNEIVVQENIVRYWDTINKETQSTSANITDDAMNRLIEAVGNTAKLLSSGASDTTIETFNSAKYSDADIKL